MKRVSTILKQIVQLEKELDLYSGEEVKQAIEKLEEDNGGSLFSPLIDVIYDGTDISDEWKYMLKQ